MRDLPVEPTIIAASGAFCDDRPSSARPCRKRPEGLIGCFQIRPRRITTATIKALPRFYLSPPLWVGKSRPPALRVVVDSAFPYGALVHCLSMQKLCKISMLLNFRNISAS
jgi:hypothetical protein